MKRSMRRLLGFAAASGLALSVGVVALGDDAKPASEPFRGALAPVAEEAPRAVRNDAHRAGREIVTLRYFKIEPGAFPEFLAASRDGVWPYFEKIGARVIGMWRVVPPPAGTPASTEYDEVYLATRYASAEHWSATHDTVAHGGNGPDWEACKKALDYRESVTLESHVTFLDGELAPGGPYFRRGCLRSSSGWSERARAERGSRPGPLARVLCWRLAAIAQRAGR